MNPSLFRSSNNTNKLSPQEQRECQRCNHLGSNNTNKLSPQEQSLFELTPSYVQIIQINLALKNFDEIGQETYAFK